MPEGILCNKKTVDTKEQLNALLADKGGKQYYEEMNHLEVDKKALQATLKNIVRSRFKTWLEICSHCGLCAERCPTGAWDMQKSTVRIPYAVDEPAGA